ncbi:MAG: hypothetical protein CMH57_14080 [Myxococcales bacterium]|nr:hypothetical protein [Myxococcales bacterium]
MDLQPHSLLSNPLQRFSGRTACSHCNQFRPVQEFAWVDTNETIAAFRERWAERAPFWARMVYTPAGTLVIWGGSTAVGLLLGLLSSQVISSWWVIGLLAFVGMVVGFFVGMIILEPILALVFRLAYQVEDPRQLI